MPANKPFRFGPIALTSTLTTNLLNPGTTTGGVNASAAPYDKTFILLRHVRILNKDSSPRTASLWLGATGGNAAGTEVIASGITIAAGSSFDWWASGGGMRLDTTDFLVGGASANTALTIEGEGEIGIA